METQVKLQMAQATNDRFSCTNAAVVSRSNLMKRAVLLQSVRTISSSSDERIYMQIYILTSFTTPSGIFKCKLKSNLGKKAKNCKKRHPKYSNGCTKWFVPLECIYFEKWRLLCVIQWNVIIIFCAQCQHQYF